MVKKFELIKFGLYQGINYYLQKITDYTSILFCKPSQIILDVTNKCNLRCKPCFAWKTKNIDNLTAEEWIKIIKNLKDSFGLFFLTITGGEPLLRKDIGKIIRFASENGLLVNLITNGTLLNKKRRQEIVNSNPYQITVSLDSTDKSIHDSIKGVKNSHFKIVSNILALKKEHPSLKLVISTVVTSYNMYSLIDLIKWVTKSNLDGIRFQAFSEPFWDNTKFDEDKLENNKLWPQNTKEITQIIEEIIKFKKRSYKIKNSYLQLKSIKEYFKNPYSKKVRCKTGINNLHITPCGEVKFCMHSKTIGNLLKEPAKKIWVSQQAKIAREEIKKCRRSCRILNCYYEENIFKKALDFLNALKN